MFKIYVAVVTSEGSGPEIADPMIAPPAQHTSLWRPGCASLLATVSLALWSAAPMAVAPAADQLACAIMHAMSAMQMPMSTRNRDPDSDSCATCAPLPCWDLSVLPRLRRAGRRRRLCLTLG